MNSVNEPNRRFLVNRLLARSAVVAWASPGTSLGVLIGVLGLASGARCQLHTGVLEFHGGFVSYLLGRLPMGPLAMTLGHVVLGRSKEALDLTRCHERVHVRQYERWGPFFIPAYLLSSAFVWMKGGDPYRQNPFEVEAFDNS